MGINSSHHRDKRALNDALATGDVASVEQVIASHPEFFASRLEKVTGNNPMHVAVMLKDHHILQQLVAHASDGSSQVHPNLKQAAARALNHGRSSDGATPLMLACDMGDEESVRILLAAGASPWKQDNNCYRTCMHYAAAKNHHTLFRPLLESSLTMSQFPPSIFHITIDEGLNRPLIDIATHGGYTPLMYAAWFDHPEAIETLIQAGAKLKYRSWGMVNSDPFCRGCPDGSSALHIAAINGSLLAIHSILSEFMLSQAPDRLGDQLRGVDPRLMLDCDGSTAFAMARRLHHFDLLPILNPVTPLSRIFDADAPEERSVGVPTLVQLAAKASHVVLMQQVGALIECTKEQRAKKALLKQALLKTPGKDAKAGRTQTLADAAAGGSATGRQPPNASSPASMSVLAASPEPLSPSQQQKPQPDHKSGVGLNALALASLEAVGAGASADVEVEGENLDDATGLSMPIPDFVVTAGAMDPITAAYVSLERDGADAATAAAAPSAAAAESMLSPHWSLRGLRSGRSSDSGESLHSGHHGKQKTRRKSSFRRPGSDAACSQPARLQPDQLLLAKRMELQRELARQLSMHERSMQAMMQRLVVPGMCESGPEDHVLQGDSGEVLQAVSQITHKMEDNDTLDDTLAACRFHRLVHGVGQSSDIQAWHGLSLPPPSTHCGNGCDEPAPIIKALMMKAPTSRSAEVMRRSSSSASEMTVVHEETEAELNELAAATAPSSQNLDPAGAGSSVVGSGAAAWHVVDMLGLGGRASVDAATAVRATDGAGRVDGGSGGASKETAPTGEAAMADVSVSETALTMYAKAAEVADWSRSCGVAVEDCPSPSLELSQLQEPERNATPTSGPALRAQRGSQRAELTGMADAASNLEGRLARSSSSASIRALAHQATGGGGGAALTSQLSRLNLMLMSPPALTAPGAESGGGSGGGPTAVSPSAAGTSLFRLSRALTPQRPLASSAAMSALSSSLLDDDVDDDDRVCGVCLDTGDLIAARPCGHKICVECAQELLRLHACDPTPCPFCRSMVRGFGAYKRPAAAQA